MLAGGSPPGPGEGAGAPFPRSGVAFGGKTTRGVAPSNLQGIAHGIAVDIPPRWNSPTLKNRIAKNPIPRATLTRISRPRDFFAPPRFPTLLFHAF